MISDNLEQTVRGILRALLETGLCEALLVPMALPFGRGVAPALVRAPELLSKARPLAPVMPVSEASLAGRLTIGEKSGTLGLVLHPCQMRAFIELVKLRQASHENVLLIGLDCAGTYELNEYLRLLGETAEPGLDLLAGLRAGEPVPHQGYRFRPACQMCEQPLPETADLWIRIVGVTAEDGVRVKSSSEVLTRLGLTPSEPSAEDSPSRRRLIESRERQRDQAFAEFRAAISGLPSLLGQFAACVRCLNCMDACPLCYCKECIFRTETFDHRPTDYERWARRNGAVRLPTDTLLFHLTRLNHMATSCVGCGLCESACPSHLPVTSLFRAVGSQVQSLFNYAPGRDEAEEIPILTFRESELE